LLVEVAVAYFYSGICLERLNESTKKSQVWKDGPQPRVEPHTSEALSLVAS